MLNRMRSKYRILGIFAALVLLLSGCSIDFSALTAGPYSNAPEIAAESAETFEGAEPSGLPEASAYYDVEHVVLYLEEYHELPYNYITKEEAQNMGWEGGSVETVLPDAAIGGDHFGNFEGSLPERNDYFECDIDTHGYKNRGSRRLIYTLDGTYYYTRDHYEHFSEVTVDENHQVIIH